MTDYEKELLDNGFSYKDIGKLNSVLKNDESQKETIQSLVLDLSRRFWGGVIGIAILILLALYGIFKSGDADAISYIIVIGFAFLVIYFVTPLKLSWKAYRFIKKTDG